MGQNVLFLGLGIGICVVVPSHSSLDTLLGLTPKLAPDPRYRSKRNYHKSLHEKKRKQMKDRGNDLQSLGMD